MISKVIDQNVFIGNIYDAQDARTLAELGIERVISLIDSDDEVVIADSNIRHEVYRIWDGDDSRLLSLCKSVTLDPEIRTLVHCSAGLSRSVSFVAAHLMKTGACNSASEAYNLIQENRMIRPHKNFVKLLKKMKKKDLNIK